MHKYKMPFRPQCSNKGTFGRVLNVSGSKNYIGAAYLSTLATLKIGAGYVTLATDEKVIDSVSRMLPEAVYSTRLNALENIEKYSVMLIGCGIGNNKESISDFINFINKTNMPTIIDADGLNILSESDNINLPPNTIITPHPLEASRLLKTDVNIILSDLKESAKKLTQKYGTITILKTHRTIICDTEFNIHINQNGNSALAKAGSGDVLSGMIAGLLAQKMDLYEAAKLGVYLHSRAGELASEELTEYSVLASDIINFLPLAIKELNK